MLSMDNQVNYLGRMAGRPVVGEIGSAFSLAVALVVTVLARVPIVWLFGGGVGSAGVRGGCGTVGQAPMAPRCAPVHWGEG